MGPDNRFERVEGDMTGKADIADLKTGIAELKTAINERFKAQTAWLCSTMIALAVVIFCTARFV